MVDPNVIVENFKLTLEMDPSRRQAGEEALRSLAGQPGFYTVIYQISTHPEFPVAARQQASIALKLAVKSGWDHFDPDDKSAIRNNLIAGMVSSPRLVLYQLEDVFLAISKKDFPENWPGVVEQLLEHLHSQNPAQLVGALSALRMLIRPLAMGSWEDDGHKELFNKLIDATFPLLLQIYHALVDQTEVEAWDILQLLNKIFFGATCATVPPYFFQVSEASDSIGSKYDSMDDGIVAPITEEEQPADHDLRHKFPKWVAKKWATYVLCTLFHRVLSPYKEGDPEGQLFEQWGKTYAIKFLEAHMTVLSGIQRGEYLHKRVLNLTLEFLTVAIRYSPTWKLLKQWLPGVFKDMLFPLMCFSEEASKMWQEDEQEFCALHFNTFKEMNDPQTSCQNLLIDICSTRGRDNVNGWMQNMYSVLMQYKEAPSYENAKQKFGAMNIIGTLSQFLMRKPKLALSIEPMLKEFIDPDFDSEFPFLRLRAIGLYTQFSEHAWIDSGHYQAIINKVVDLFVSDPELPVRVSAGINLQYLIMAQNDETEEIYALPVIGPRLGDVLRAYLTITREIDNEELAAAMGIIIGHFEDDIGPYALTIVEAILEQAPRLFSASIDDDVAQETAVESLANINTILMSISEKKALYEPMARALVPHIPMMLQSEVGMDAMEETLKIISYLTFSMPDEMGIPEPVWSCYLPMIQSFHNFGADYLGSLITPLDNFISYATDAFLSKPEYMEATFSIYAKVFQDQNFRDPDVCEAAKIMEVLMQNCQDRIDGYIAPAITMAMERYPTVTTNAAHVMILEVIINAFYYNPYLTCHTLSEKGWLEPLFQTWFSQLQHFTRMHDKRISVLALGRLLMMDADKLPPEIARNIKAILDQAIALTLSFEKQRVEEQAKAEEEEKQLAEMGTGTVVVDDESEESSEDIGSAEDVGNDDDEAYLQALSNRIQEWKAQNKAAGGKHILYEDEDELEDEENFTTPLDFIDPSGWVLDAMKVCQEKNPQMYQHLHESLTEEQHQQMAYLTHLAEEARQRDEQEKAELREQIEKEKQEEANQ